MTSIPGVHHESELPRERLGVYAGPAYNAFRILQIAFVAAPIVAGLDKFLNRMTDWGKYLAPQFANMIGGNVHGCMMLVGVIEILAGIGVALKPKYFGYVVSAWLVLIIINLVMLGAHYDIALRDLGLAMGSFALARLGMLYDHGMFGGLYTHDTTTVRGA